MKKFLFVLMFAALTGCAPYVDRSEIEVFTHACKDDGGVNSIGTFFGVTSAKCMSGKVVAHYEASNSYQQSLKARPVVE